MPVISVINYKGGVGKTTLTANVGAELAWRGYRVLLLDLDPQASLTFSFVRPDYWNKHLSQERTIKSWYDAMQYRQSVDLRSLAFSPSQVNPSLRAYLGNRRFDIIPSHLGLINVDLELATELGGASIRQSKLNYMRVHQRLAQGLADPSFEDYDIIMIDCPPNFNVVTKTAIVASDYILIPAKPDYLSTLGIDYLKRNLDALVGDYNEYVNLESGGDNRKIAPVILGVVFTMVQIYGGVPIAAQRSYITQTKHLKLPVFGSTLRENKTLFASAPEEGVPIVLRGHASYRHVVSELEAFVNELVEKLAIQAP